MSAVLITILIMPSLVAIIFLCFFLWTQKAEDKLNDRDKDSRKRTMIIARPLVLVLLILAAILSISLAISIYVKDEDKVILGTLVTNGGNGGVFPIIVFGLFTLSSFFSGVCSFLWKIVIYEDRDYIEHRTFYGLKRKIYYSDMIGYTVTRKHGITKIKTKKWYISCMCDEMDMNYNYLIHQLKMHKIHQIN